MTNDNNSNRPDDFVDNNSTHISIMAHLHIAHPEFATCEDDVRDDEFWGYIPIIYTSKIDDIAMAIKQEIDIL